jgi:hypothetical protein
MTQVTFGEDLAFAGIDTPNMVGVIENGKVSVRISHGESNGTISGFTSKSQAEEGIAVAQRMVASLHLCADNEQFDLAFAFLAMIADKSYLPQLPDEDEAYFDFLEGEAIDNAIDDWKVERL